MSQPIQWQVAESWLAEDANMRQVARELRAESEEFKRAYYEAVVCGADPATIKGLKMSFWSTVSKAAEIERKIRGI